MKALKMKFKEKPSMEKLQLSDVELFNMIMKSLDKLVEGDRIDGDLYTVFKTSCE